MAVPEYIIEKIRNSNDIISVVSECIILKKTGANYKALCPFHKEKTPSFVVSPEKQIYHCFGCGEGGNVFNFIMKYENVGFFESLKKLADRSGIVLPDGAGRKYQDKDKKEKELLYEINQCAAEFYHDCLEKNHSAKEAREYVKKRGITKEIVDKFKLGYAPATFREMLKIGEEKKYSEDLLKKAGLIAFSEKSSKWIDKFIDRIIFPIADYEGRIIAFGGRTLRDVTPKYLNSPDTLLFNKSKVLYGLNLARKSIREKGRMILVEGYMDVITAHQYGFDNTVATMGTALTRDHAGIIPRYTEKVSIVYDSDAAGIKATLRGIDVLLDTNLRVTIAVFPEGDDPDSFLRSNGKEKFFQKVEEGMEMVDYEIKVASEGVDLNTTNGKVSVATQILSLLGHEDSKSIRSEEVLQKLSDAVKVKKDVLREELKKMLKGKSILRKTVESDKRQIKAELELEMSLVQVLLKYPELISVAFGEKKLSADGFNDKILSVIVSVISQLYEQGKTVNPMTVMNHVSSQYEQDSGMIEEINKIISSLSLKKIEYRSPEKVLRKYIDDSNKIKRKKKYNELMKEAPEYLDKGSKEELNKVRQYIEQSKLLKGTNS